MIPLIITGFDEDCKKLMIMFEKESTVRFSVFTKIWQDMNFSLVYSGRRAREIVYFTDEVLAYTKSFFIHTTSFLRKVCAMYIMYGLYFKQPVKWAGKIMLTLDEWLDLTDFISALQENGHYDTLYITLKLVFDNAFELSVSGTKHKYIGTQSEKYTRDIYDTQPELKINDLLETLENVEKSYKKAKEKLSVSLNVPKIEYTQDNVSEMLKNILNDESSESQTKNN